MRVGRDVQHVPGEASRQDAGRSVEADEEPVAIVSVEAVPTRPQQQRPVDAVDLRAELVEDDRAREITALDRLVDD